ncbi:hypothetical protein [Oleiagrimonas soli]|uniref:Uncharacterized protein n=1 Tax=Oleiagrimonas soli TaxID=1543381 RepID=A0A099CUQ9_9GAMM|nr:hypothetical protein [Oleiagrimonas soli]KGI77673.1 hypothetical protein LF63_0110390 [Oleiagrimonas soli]MBB6182803.1 hypothetical protein [Oleiagrimonas soli]
MKIYGRIDGSGFDAETSLRRLAEVTLVATPNELRRIDIFLSPSAETMERMGASHDHEHLSDRVDGFDAAPGFVVAQASSGDA